MKKTTKTAPKPKTKPKTTPKTKPKPKTPILHKYTPETVEHILQLTRSDTYTTAEICRQVGIGARTYYLWKEQHPEFAQAIEEAQQERKEAMAQEAKQSLLKKVRGYEVKETKVVEVPTAEGETVVRERTTITKHVQPDTAAIIFTLTNTDPANWRNRHYNEHTGRDGRDLFQQMSDEELEARIAQLQAQQSPDP